MRVLIVILALVSVCLAQDVAIHAVVIGKVKKVYVKEGQRVKKGQLLMEIDPALYLADERKLLGKKKELSARLWKVERDYFRLKELFERDLLAETRFEDQKIRYDTLKAQIDQVDGELERVKVLISYTKIHAPFSGRVKKVLVGEGGYVNGSLQPHAVLVIEK